MENSQLDAAIRKEMGVQGQEGTNSETVKEEAAEKAEPAAAQAESTEAPEDTPEQKEKPEEKRRSNVPKILRERNELRREVEELKAKLNSAPEASADAQEAQAPDLDSKIREILRAEREELATQSFFESNADAKANKKAVESLMDDYGLPASDALALYLAKNDPKALTKNATKATSSPSMPNFGNRKDRSIASMKTDDMESALRDSFKKGELSI